MMTTQTEEPLSREDQFVRTSNRRALVYAGAFGLWQLAQVLREQAAGREARTALLAVSLSAGAAWCVLLVLMIRAGRLIRQDPALCAAVNDERVQGVRLRAYRIAFWTTVGAAALLGVPSASHAVDASVVTSLIVVTGVVSFIVSAVVLDRE